MIDRLLGGSNADLFIPQRPLTEIEQRLVQKILVRAMKSLEEAWSTITPLNISLDDTESNPQLVQIVPPNEVVVVIGFELKMGGRAGTMSLCIPYAVIEPVMDKLNNQSWSQYKRARRDETLRGQVKRKLDDAELTLTSVLGETTMKLSDLMGLSEGDVIVTSKPSGAPLTLLVEGKRKFIGQIGQFGGNRAFKVTRSYGQRDRV